MAEPGRLQQRRILITGAASGIGRRTALLFAAEGAALTLLDRSIEGLSEVARETGGTAFAADVTDEGSVAQAVERGAAAMGSINGVVNAAGIVIRGSVLEVGAADWRRVIDVNLTGTYVVVRLLPAVAHQSKRSDHREHRIGPGSFTQYAGNDSLCRFQGRRRQSNACSCGRTSARDPRQQRMPRYGGYADDGRRSARCDAVCAEAHSRSAGDRARHPVPNGL
jgi:NAD(P)-dependent dehydrogenase (short-subunit alcohol dehydrogenase family)